jgi:hypothetical protein
MVTIKRRSRRGIALIWVAIIALAAIALVGLAMDTGYALWAAHKLQIAADSAALAGASQVGSGTDLARNAAQTLSASNKTAGRPVQLAANPGNASGGDIVIGRYDSASGQFTPTLTSPNAVKVKARLTSDSPNGPLALNFGPAFGINSVDIVREAIAITGAEIRPGIVILDPSASDALHVWGNSAVTVNDGDVLVKSTSTTSIRIGGSSDLNADGVYAGGQVSAPYVSVSTDSIVDPLASLPAPTWNPSAKLGKITNGTYSPGYYEQGLDATGDITLLPGIYILGGAGLTVGKNKNLTANGVMLYITGGAGIDMGGGGRIVITAPDPAVNHFAGADTYAGVAIFQDRSDTKAGTMQGNSGLFSVQGTIYVPSAALNYGGSTQYTCSQLIVKTLSLQGTPSMTVNYTGGNDIPRNRSWLVQ